MLKHKCWKTVLKHKCWNTGAGTQMLEHRAGTQKLTQMVKVVIDGNRLVMEHAQEMLEHRS
jgi:hypothetical protein